MERGIVVLLVLLISPAVYAQTSHIVGDTAGWDNSVNFANWARGKNFTVGDSLVFNYDTSHAVDEVTAGDYTACSSANAISTDSNSPTTITLSTAGAHYFICPRSNHCGQGQKLTITAVAAASTPSPPPPPGGTTPSPPTGGATPSPPSEGTTPSTPTPTTPTPARPDGSAAAALGGGKTLMAGLSLVVMGALLG